MRGRSKYGLETNIFLCLTQNYVVKAFIVMNRMGQKKKVK